MAGQVISMTGPALDGWRFLCACLIGLPLGLCYGFLRPLRSRHPFLADLLFLPAMGYAWLYLGFAICRGDLRLGYCLGLFLGAVFWELTIGQLLKPVFRGFWRIVSRIFRGFFNIFKKFFKKIGVFLKIVFALWKKWFTIVETNRCRICNNRGGAPNGKTE